MAKESKTIKLEKEKERLKVKHNLVLGLANLLGLKRISKRLGDIDQEILYLVKTNDGELEILREYHKLKSMRNESDLNKLQAQEQLIKKLIDKNNAKDAVESKCKEDVTKIGFSL